MTSQPRSHQSVTSSDAEKRADGDSVVSVDYTDGEWHDWHGGECPVDNAVKAQVELRDGNRGRIAAGILRWTHDGDSGDIIRFRVIK